jgi:hypothetical protein
MSEESKPMTNKPIEIMKNLFRLTALLRLRPGAET